jgi:hypothetical protein
MDRRSFVKRAGLAGIAAGLPALRVLEFESLRQLLRGYAQSPIGQKLISELAPVLRQNSVGS